MTTTANGHEKKSCSIHTNHKENGNGRLDENSSNRVGSSNSENSTCDHTNKIEITNGM